MDSVAINKVRNGYYVQIDPDYSSSRPMADHIAVFNSIEDLCLWLRVEFAKVDKPKVENGMATSVMKVREDEPLRGMTLDRSPSAVEALRVETPPIPRRRVR